MRRKTEINIEGRKCGKEGRMTEVFVSSVYSGSHHGNDKLLFTAIFLPPPTHIFSVAPIT